MPDAPSFSLQQLSNALQQLFQSPRQSAVNQQAIDVLVKHLSGEQLLLISANGQQQVSNAQLSGELQNGQQYQLQLGKNNQLLLFFATEKAAPIQLAIKDTLFQQLLQIPPLQLKSAATSAIQLNALITNISAQSIELSLLSADNKQPIQQAVLQKLLPLLTAQAKSPLTTNMELGNTQQQRHTTPPAFNNASAKQDLQIALPVANPQKLQLGQQVTLELRPQGKEWQLVIINQQNKAQRPIALMPESAQQLLGAISASKGLMLPSNIVAKLAPLLPSNVQTTLNQWLAADDKPQLSVKINSANQPILQIQPKDKPLASIELTKQQAKQIVELLPVKSAQSVNGSLTPTLTDSATSPRQTTIPQTLQTLLRQLQPQQDSPTKLMNQLERIVNDPLIAKSPELKPLIEKLFQQIEQTQPQGKEPEHQQLKALLTSSALPITPIQLVSPPPTQGFVAGIVAMLQLSLAARLARNQPAQSDKLADAISTLLGDKTAGTTNSNVTGRNLRDMSQLEQQQQLSKTLSRLLANHQGNKIASAEQQLQGQDNLFYNFSTGQGAERKDVELLIRREPESSDKKKSAKKSGQRWHLTMKLDIGSLGEVLTKAVLQKNQLELDFYTSNQDTLHQLMNFLPLLKKRFKALQIEVSRSQCQLGKIPATLQQRPYQLFETKV
ncbi:flagellar hook-length control protein FliK [Neptunicella sp.]|uniref:flagellar hook-length control protein FliK n=1 Tax=Neptunicella sp. TaxID=2125986 RepID=UPI003F68CA7D